MHRLGYPMVMLCLLGCLLAFPFFLYHEPHTITQLLLNNADAFYLPTLFQHHGFHFSDLKHWYLTPAPYFFPDWILYACATLCASSTVTVIMLYSTFQIILLMIALWTLYDALRLPYTLGCVILTTWALCYLAILGIEPLSLIIYSAHHYGCFIIGIFCTALMILWDRHRSFWVLYSVILLGLLTTFSDSLFLTQWVLPAALAHCSLKKRYEFIWPMLLVLMAAMLGYFIYPYVIAHPTRYSLAISSHAWQTQLPNLYHLGASVFHRMPIYSIGVMICYATLAYRTLFSSTTLEGSRRMIERFISISCITTIIPTLCVMHFPVSLRYFIPVFSWPILILAIAIQSNLQHKLYTQLCTILLCCLSFFKASHAPDPPRDILSDLPCLDRVFDAYPHLKHGIANYWDAKIYQTMSRHNITLAQYHLHVEPHYWITSDTFFHRHYDMVIRSRDAVPPFDLPLQDLKANMGTPNVIAHCAHHDILIYATQSVTR